MEEYLVDSKILEDKVVISDYINNPTLQNLTEPVMLVFGYVNEKNKGLYKSGDFKAVEQYKNDNGEQVAQTLRDAKYRAAFYTEKRASRPSYIAVTETGIITPFYQPDEAPQIARDILETLVRANVALPLSFVWGTTFNQLTQPAPRGKQNFRSVLGEKLPHPNPKRFDEIMKNHEEGFYKNMLNIAYENKENLSDLCSKYGFGAACHGGITSQPDVIFAKNNLEARNIVYGTLEFKQAYKYALITDASRGKDYQYGFDFGFLHIYKPTGNVFLLPGGAAETGGINDKVNGLESKYSRFNDMEFPLCKSNVEYVETLVCFEDGAFLIPNNDKDWEDFKELSQVSYYDERERMLFRRENLIMQEFLNNNAVITYSPKGRMQKESIDNDVKNYMSKVRNKLAKKIDKALGTKSAPLKAPQVIKKLEREASILRFKALNKINTK